MVTLRRARETAPIVEAIEEVIPDELESRIRSTWVEKIQPAVERIQPAAEHARVAAAEHARDLRDRVEHEIEARRAAASPGEPARPSGVRRALGIAGRSLALVWGGIMVAAVGGAVVARSMKGRTIAKAAPDADEVGLVAIFGPLAFHSTATAFRGGTVECWYGGGVIDLRDAVLAPEGAVLRVRAIFGGGQILVPSTWEVAGKIRGIGGMRDIRPAAERAPEAPHLLVEGIAIFGGFAVQPELTEKEEQSFEQALARETAVAPDAPVVPVMEPTRPTETLPIGAG